ncbi:M48 family metallopeptidase [Streptomyces laurentii]
MPVDPRFVVWCAACGWDADPGDEAKRPDQGLFERLRRGMARRYGEQLYAELTLTGTGARRSPAARVLAVLLALLVHGITLAVLVSGLWLLIAGWGEGIQPFLGVLLLGLAVVLRPRLGGPARLRESEAVLERADAPHLFALLDDVAEAVGTRGVDIVVVEADANAAVQTYGLRRQRVLWLGMSLWAVLSPQERVALLGHEFGHYAHGDTRHSLVVGSALRTLGEWRYLLTGFPTTNLVEQAAGLLTVPPRWAVQGLTLLLDQATLRDAQRSEYRADASAARVGGRAAAVGLLDRLFVADATGAALERERIAARTRAPGAERRQDPADGLWNRLAEWIASVPAHEYARLRRVAELRGHRVDDTHPPTHLRRDLLAADAGTALCAAGFGGPALVVDAARAAAVDIDLALPARTVAKQVLEADG